MTLSVHIIGAGAAGCATALSLQQHATRLNLAVSITLVNQSNGMVERTSETVPPTAIDLLHQLGLLDVLNDGHLSCPGSISIWGNKTPGYNDFLFTPAGQGYHLNSDLFHQQLLEHCLSVGIKLINNTVVTHAAINASDVVLSLAESPSQEKIRKITTHFVIDATGINGLNTAKDFDVDTLTATRTQYDSIISLSAFYEAPSTDIFDSIKKTSHALISSSNIGWWRAAQLPDNRAIISLHTDSTTLENNDLNHPPVWFQQLANTSWLFNKCQDQFQKSLDFPSKLQWRVLPSSVLTRCAGERWLAVGDAASSHDPITSSATTKALSHGILAGRTTAQYLSSPNPTVLEDYQTRVHDDFHQYLRQHQLLYSKEQRYINSGFWQRRLLN